MVQKAIATKPHAGPNEPVKTVAKRDRASDAAIVISDNNPNPGVDQKRRHAGIL